MPQNAVQADLHGNRITVEFPYSPDDVDAIKTIPGRRWAKEARQWTLPADLESGRALRRVFGDRLELSPVLRAWGAERRAQEAELHALTLGETADAPTLENVRPSIREVLHPYQAADVAFMARTPCINANEPGLGKTLTTIAAAEEAGILHGRVLVAVNMLTAITNVWAKELGVWTPDVNVVIPRGDWGYERPGWFLTTHAALSRGMVPAWQWDAVIVDEFHVSGLKNHKSKAADNAKSLGRGGHRWLLSGTPIDGKATGIFGGLQFVAPDEFTSFWTWANRWIDFEENPYGGHTFHGLRADRERDFFRSHATRIIRRTKPEVAHWLPPIRYERLEVRQTTKQRRQAAAIVEDCLLDDRLSVTGALAQLTRIAQIASGEVEVTDDDKIVYTASPKVEQLVATLAELGHRKDGPRDIPPAVVTTRWKNLAAFALSELRRAGVAAEMITGDVSPKVRADIVRRFQDEGTVPVLVMTTSVGGASLTLDRADTLHRLDRSLSSAENEQVENRIHRISRAHNCTVYDYVSGPFDEMLDDLLGRKIEVNIRTLSIRETLAMIAGIGSKLPVRNLPKNNKNY